MILLILAILGIASAGRLGEHNTGHHHHAAGTFGHHAVSTGSTSDPHSAVVTRILTVNGIMTFEDHACVFRNGEIRIRGTPLSIGQSGTFEVVAGLAYLQTGEHVNIDDGLISVLVLPSTNLQPLVDSLARAGLTPDQFIQLTGTIPPQQGIVDVTAGVMSINGHLKNVIAGVLVVLSAELIDPVSTEGTQTPIINPGVASVGKLGLDQRDATNTLFGSQGTSQSSESSPNSALQPDTRPMYMKTSTYSAAFVMDGQRFIVPNSESITRGPFIPIGESGEFSLESGLVTLGTGEQIQVNGGTLNVIKIATDAQAISNALAKTGITLDRFIQLTGAFSPQQKFFEITASIISIDGSYRNVNTGVLKILSEETLQLLNPTDKGVASVGKLGLDQRDATNTLFGSQRTSQSNESSPNSALQSDTRPMYMKTSTYSAALVMDGQRFIIPNSELLNRGPCIPIGESGEVSLESGLVTIATGEQIQVNGGTLNVIKLATDAQAISNALAKTGITLDRFIQLTGALSPQQRFFEITASIISIDGSYRNVNTGVFKIISETLQVLNPTDKETQPPVDLATELVQTVTVTETAAHETETVFEPVTLIKTQTRDEFVTVTSPVYNTIAATITNLVKQTVTIPEEQVIRSPVAGSLVVNTIPVPFQTVLTVTNRATNLYVLTITEQIVNPHDHYVTNYSIGTVTVNNPVTSTVVQTITRTSVATTYITSTVGSTVYTTTTEVIYIGGATGTAIPGGAY